MTYRSDQGSVPVKISVEDALPSEVGWRCGYSIGWSDGRHTGFDFGIDALQAVTLALHAIGTDIYTSDYHRSGRLFWEKPGQGYGFPVPNTIRDLLVGDDARFFG